MRTDFPGPRRGRGTFCGATTPEALKNYLRTVQEVKATTFDVQWNPEMVEINREAAIRALHSVSRDGVTFVFVSNEPAVTKLKAGSIMWVRDLALRKVDGVETQGGFTTVRTSVVTLNEAMPNARIEFEAPVPVQNFMLSRPEPPQENAAAKTSSLAHRFYGFVPVL